MAGSLPVVELDDLVHIGTLDRRHKKGWSLEGSGLSVSECPDAWEEIARLGGSPWWRCERPGHRFIAALSLSSRQRQAMVRWGVQLGLVRRVGVWRVTYYDEELEGERFFLCVTREEALAEAEAIEAGAPTKQRTLEGTDELSARMGQAAGLDCFDYLLLAYAEDRGYDGVFWDELLDPPLLSAPRAAIVAPRVGDWTFTRIERSSRLRCA